MGGDVIIKVLVLLAGLTAVGASVSPLLFDPAVEEAEEEDILETDARDPLLDPNPIRDENADLDLVALPENVDGDATVVTDPVEADPLLDDAPLIRSDPERSVIPFFVTIPVIVIALCFTVWAMLTPAGELGQPALFAGIVVLLGTALAWFLYEVGVSEFEMTGTALAAWLSVGFTLLAVWLIADVLSSPAEDDAVPG
ncbi:hypothetical protein [Alienimonas chondri]|uniref:Uncharacterized protein n=1 Tax=Alienimonas chondri TaxID=2681879 RepID=A0ABX1VFB9_9PLAN|nr:hypothetical protein [Alienimonas chondri]NNJ26799.1 hypothetical protein [Alienimonas chondri]